MNGAATGRYTTSLDKGWDQQSFSSIFHNRVLIKKKSFIKEIVKKPAAEDLQNAVALCSYGPSVCMQPEVVEKLHCINETAPSIQALQGNSLCQVRVNPEKKQLDYRSKAKFLKSTTFRPSTGNKANINRIKKTKINKNCPGGMKTILCFQTSELCQHRLVGR